jgi:hypothetical protein
MRKVRDLIICPLEVRETDAYSGVWPWQLHVPAPESLQGGVRSQS